MSSETLVSPPNPLPDYQFTKICREDRQYYSHDIPQPLLGLPWIEWTHTGTSRKSLSIHLEILLTQGRTIPIQFCDLGRSGNGGWDAGWSLLQQSTTVKGYKRV